MAEIIHLVCPKCHTVNRVQAGRLAQDPKCGKCHATLLRAESVKLKGEGFARHLQKSELPLLVDFWAPWCGPCKNMAPAFEEAARMLHPRLRLAKVNTEEERELAARYGIQSIPTMVLFKGGREKARISGAMPAQSIVSWAREQLRG